MRGGFDRYMKTSTTCLTPEEILRGINTTNKVRERALVAFLYATGGRISEALQVKAKDVHNTNIKYSNVIHEYVRRDCMVIDMPILKRKRKGVGPDIRRSVAIVCEEDEPFRDIIREYVALYKAPGGGWSLKIKSIYDKGGEKRLFDFTRTTAYNIVKRVLGVHPHVLRHSRITWLVKDKGFSEQMLRQYIGWADSRPAQTYVHLNY